MIRCCPNNEYDCWPKWKLIDGVIIREFMDHDSSIKFARVRSCGVKFSILIFRDLTFYLELSIITIPLPLSESGIPELENSLTGYDHIKAS